MEFDKIDPNRFVVLKTGEKAIIVDLKDKENITVSVNMQNRVVTSDDIEQNDNSKYSERRFWEPPVGKVVGKTEISSEAREANSKRLDELISDFGIS